MFWQQSQQACQGYWGQLAETAVSGQDNVLPGPLHSKKKSPGQNMIAPLE